MTEAKRVVIYSDDDEGSYDDQSSDSEESSECDDSLSNYRKELSEEFTQVEIEKAMFVAIRLDRTQMLRELINSFQRHENLFYPSELNEYFLSIAIQNKSIRSLDILLNTDQIFKSGCSVKIIRMCLEQNPIYVVAFVRVFFKKLFRERKIPDCLNQLTANELRVVLDSLIEYFKMPTEQNSEQVGDLEQEDECTMDDLRKYGLFVSYYFELVDKFQIFMDLTKDGKEVMSLLDLQHPVDGNQILKMCLDRSRPYLSESSNVNNWLLRFMENAKHFEIFEVIWNCVNSASPGSANIFLLQLCSIGSNSMKRWSISNEVLSFLLNQCSLHSVTQVLLLNENSFEIEFRNAFWLLALMKFQFWDGTPSGDLLRLNVLEEKLEIKWTQELFEWSVAQISRFFAFKTTWLLKNPKIDKSWWGENRIRDYLLQAIRNLDTEFFDLLIELFPNMDLTFNNYEALRTLVQLHRCKNFEQMIERFGWHMKFKTYADRQSFRGFRLAKEVRRFQVKMKTEK